MPSAEIAGEPSADPAPAEPRPEIPATPAPVFDGILAFVVLALAAFLASFAAVNADVWLDLAAGRLVAEGHYPFGADPFSVIPTTWINQAWLFDLAAYLLYQPGGAVLIAVKAGLVVALAAVLLAIRRPNGGGLGPAAATTLVLLAASPLFVLRPAVASYLLFAVLLLVLHRRLGPRGRWQLPLAAGLLFALWVNLDDGYVFGLMLLAIWTVGAVVQQIIALGESADDPGEARHPPKVLATAFLAALIGCLLNPYHVHVFRLPAELTAPQLPASVLADPQVEHIFRDRFFVAPFSRVFTTEAGPAAAGAFYVILGLGLASFAVNVAGWRWRRVLAWTVFACLATTYGRTIPYFAMIGGVALVLNFQACLARNRATCAEKPNPRWDHLRGMTAATGRVGLLLAVVVLLALAWPGWLGADARTSAAPARRVAWRLIPEPTYERLANRLAAWYKSGELREGQARAFHLQPDFTAYCAWACPAEKSAFDSRMTAPPDVLADYVALRQAMVAIARPAGPHHPDPPGPLLIKLDITHLVLSGEEMLAAPPFRIGLSDVIFRSPVRLPLWAIEGEGVICGWRRPQPALRLNPIRLAVGEAVEPLPEPVEVPPPIAPTLWDRYFSAPMPPAPEAAEAGLWLAVQRALEWRGENVAVNAAADVGYVSQLAPAAPAAALGRLVEEFAMRAINARNAFVAAWRQSPESRVGRAATVLAIRAARRAIQENPDSAQAYSRLAQAYSVFETDPALGIYQELATAHQAIARLEIAAPHRKSLFGDEMLLQNTLLNLYGNVVIPHFQAHPDDLRLESLKRLIDLQRVVYEPVVQADPNGPEVRRIHANEEKLRQELEPLVEKVRKASDEYENEAHNAKPAKRAQIACRYGLAREALKVLREAEPRDRDFGSVQLMANLLLLAGEAEDARDLMQNKDLTDFGKFPILQQIQIHILRVQTTAALGDYATAIEHCDAILSLRAPSVRPTAIRLFGELLLQDSAVDHAWMLAGSLPVWAVDLASLADNLGQQANWTVRKGMLALESGDVESAHREFAVGARGRAGTEAAVLARIWLELWR